MHNIWIHLMIRYSGKFINDESWSFSSFLLVYGKLFTKKDKKSITPNYQALKRVFDWYNAYDFYTYFFTFPPLIILRFSTIFLTPYQVLQFYLSKNFRILVPICTPKYIKNIFKWSLVPSYFASAKRSIFCF